MLSPNPSPSPNPTVRPSFNGGKGLRLVPPPEPIPEAVGNDIDAVSEMVVGGVEGATESSFSISWPAGPRSELLAVVVLVKVGTVMEGGEVCGSDAGPSIGPVGVAVRGEGALPNCGWVVGVRLGNAAADAVLGLSETS